MGKHKRKVDAALAARQAAATTGPGFKMPGSRNRRKGWKSDPVYRPAAKTPGA